MITPSLENCDAEITPDCLRALYSINYTAVATQNNTFGVGEFLPPIKLLIAETVFQSNFRPGHIFSTTLISSFRELLAYWLS